MIYYLAQTILAFLVVILVIVVTHEFGHYLASRLFGIKVTDFSVGFGPTLLKFKDKWGTTWRLSAIPLGGYIKHLGDIDATSLHGTTKGLSTSEKKQAFITQSVWKKCIVAIAGPVGNFVTAIVIFTCLFVVVGKPTYDNKIMAVEPNSAAYNSGLKVGDAIKFINDDEIKDLAIAERMIASHPNVPMKFGIERAGQLFTIIITPDAHEIQQGKDKYTVGKLGVIPKITKQKYSIVPAFVMACRDTLGMSKLILKITGQLITGSRSVKELGSIIRISRASGEAINHGVGALALFIAIISINVGLFNLFPILPLDGGAVIFHVLRCIIGEKAANRFENYAIKIGIVLLIVIMIVALTNDVNYLRNLK